MILLHNFSLVRKQGQPVGSGESGAAIDRDYRSGSLEREREREKLCCPWVGWLGARESGEAAKRGEENVPPQ
jgi:hypothetical protein